ncbi:MAG: 2,3-bisphosphoglycerate-independent phosphoglycerate mutase [Candidatus Pacebacteria bacterium]|nr:2,3-bisphosphoglycerate-independent phosphoglycerate mutase [Candidatus Paceibacterota bacterium]
MNKKQVALIILDGWGYRAEKKDNAILQANKPNYDNLWDTYPHSLLKASGTAVGLPEGQMGNSEVGHMTMGAGKVLDQELVRINNDIEKGVFSSNPVFKILFEHVKTNNSTLHIMGLLSDGGVHSHISHLFAFLKTAKDNNISKVVIHVFTDGRDVPPQSASIFVKELENKILGIGVGKIASVSGRFYAMDRDKNWDRILKTEEAIFESKGDVCKISPSEYIENLYKDGKVDEHLVPFVCEDENGEKHLLQKNDGVFFFNFRADRSRQLTSKIIEKQKDYNFCLATMTSYGDDYPTLVAYSPIKVNTTLAKEISLADLTQVHIAETEKFAHVTYFFNGGEEGCYKGEEHALIPSRKDIKTYDLAPKMRAVEIADKTIEEIKKGTNFILINFANADMVGHTSEVPAIINAVEEIDVELGRIIKELKLNGGVACITADHGNAEINIDPTTGLKHTAHTSSPVPFILTDISKKLKEAGGLADVAPTILGLFDLKKPEEMTGESLMIKN